MKSCLMLNCLKFHHIIHDTTAFMHYSKYPVLAKNDILGSWLIACCKLAPTLVGLIWRHNCVIGRNEYLISILSKSTFSCVYSLQILFISTHNSWRYERKCEWVFFWTQCILWLNGVKQTAYRNLGSRMWEINWYQYEWPWPLFRVV